MQTCLHLRRLAPGCVPPTFEPRLWVRSAAPERRFDPAGSAAAGRLSLSRLPEVAAQQPVGAPPDDAQPGAPGAERRASRGKGRRWSEGWSSPGAELAEAGGGGAPAPGRRPRSDNALQPGRRPSAWQRPSDAAGCSSESVGRDERQQADNTSACCSGIPARGGSVAAVAQAADRRLVNIRPARDAEDALIP